MAKSKLAKLTSKYGKKSSSGGDRHKYNVVAYRTENSYKDKAGSVFVNKSMSFDDAKKEQERLSEGDTFYAVAITAVKDDREVSVVLNEDYKRIDETGDGFKKGGRTKAAIAADKNVKAKHPGKRTSASGRTYFESRANRSDVNRTKKFDDGGAANKGIAVGDLVFDKNVGHSGLVGLVIKKKKNLLDIYYRGLRGEVMEEVPESDVKDVRDGYLHIAFDKGDIGFYRSIAKKNDYAMNQYPEYDADEEEYKKGGRTKAGIAADKNIKAKHPGKRTSASGRTYFESRPNRSDVNRTKKFDDGGKVTEPELLVDSHHGVYVPQIFVNQYDLTKFGFTKEKAEEYKKDLSSPDNEEYWDAWDELLSNAKMEDGSYLDQNEDLWLVPKDFEGFDSYAKGGQPKKPLSYYKYETPRITIYWKGKEQPLGRFKTAEEAFEVIKKQSAMNGDMDQYKIYTPDGILDLTKEGHFEKGGDVKKEINGLPLKVVFGVTYETVTPESAEQGDFDDTGWEVEKEEVDLVDALHDAVHRYGAYSGFDYQSRNDGFSVRANDPDRDYETGEDKYYTAFFEGLTEEQSKRVYELVKDGRAPSYEKIYGEYEDGDKYKKGGRTKAAISADKNVKALHPGKRTSESGKTYFESRANRSDVNRTKKFAKGGSAGVKEISFEEAKSMFLTSHVVSSPYNLHNVDDSNRAIKHWLTLESKKKGVNLINAIWMTSEKMYIVAPEGYFVVNGVTEKQYDKFWQDRELPDNESYAKGGIAKDSMSKVSARVPGDEEFKEGAIIIGITKSGEILTADVFNGKYGGNEKPYFTVSGTTVEPYTMSAAKKYAKQYWTDFFEQEPEQMQDMNERMGTKFRSASSAAQYVLDTDGELHGFDVYSKFGEKSLLGKDYVFLHTGGGQNRDQFDNLSVKYVPDSYLSELLRLWDTYHLKELPASENIPFLSQDEDAILADAIKAISKRKFTDGGQVAQYDFEDWSKYNDQDLAHDIELFAENDSDLYRQSYVPIVKNLKKKLDKGTFDVKLAAKLWMYYVQSADKKYQKDVNGTTPKGFLLSVNDRKLLSERMAESILNEYNINKLDGFAKGGDVSADNIEDLFEKATNAGETIVDELVEDSNGFGYEEYYDRNTAEVEHKPMSGFIPFTNGGVACTWFEHMSTLLGMGKRLPTNTLQASMEKMQEQSYEFAQNRFKEEYPEIVENLGKDKINYHDLYEEGYGSEAERLSEWENDYLSDEDSIMMQVGFYLYKPHNSRAVDGKPTCYVFAKVNLEAPYHREGNLEDYEDEEFTFHNEEGFKKKLTAALQKIKTWFEGGKYEQGKPLSIRRMKVGGSVADTSVQYADLPGDQFARGGVTRIANGEAKEYSENRMPFKGANLEGKELDNGDYAVLSYGHYPIWYYSKNEQKWYGNSTKYSVTTSKQTSQSRPTYDPVMLTHQELLEKMLQEDARFDLGGMMIKPLYPMSMDNTTAAHAGSAIDAQQVI